ncbi:MAG: proton-conducting transporter membrane subunit [Anaerosomatales bacterium]
MVTILPVWMALAAALVPLLVAAGCALPSTRISARRALPFAALPALAAAALVPEGSVSVDWLMTGVLVDLDATGRVFLALSALVWTAAALYAPPRASSRPTWFAGWFALSMAGNLALCCVTDPAAFYTFFAMMALSTYALVSSGGDRSAGRAYMAFTVVGEAFLVGGLFVAGAAALGVDPGPVLGPVGIGLVLAAFGTKIGAVGLHGWMPVTYAAAPAAVAAALAGSMSKAGVLGLVRFLPAGQEAGIAFGPVVIAFGLAAAFYGAAVGVTQTRPKVVLAYSSISQFGLITAALGVGLAEPVAWLLAVAAATAYSVHHGLAKAALFIGEDIARRARSSRLTLLGLALPSLALAGAPLTSGAVAKLVLKEATGLAPGPWHDALEMLLPLAAVGTTLLVARFLYLVATRRAPAPSGTEVDAPTPRHVVVWLLLLAAVAVTLWVWPETGIRYAAEKSLTAHYLWVASWPVLAGIVAAAAVWAAGSAMSRFAGVLPPSDIYAPVLAWADRLVERREKAVHATPAASAPVVSPAGKRGRALLEYAGALETGLLAWATAASAIGALTVLLLLLAMRG